MKEHVKNGRLFMLLATIIIAGSLFTGEAAYAAGTETLASGSYTGEDGQAAVDWTLDQDGTLTLSKNGEKDQECPVVDVEGQEWGAYSSQIKKIVFGEGIQVIWDNAFREYTNLTEINVPASVTEITYGAFADCSSLKTVTLQDGLTLIGFEAFSGCVSLETIQLPNTVETIRGCAFMDCKKLTSICIPASVSKLDDEPEPNKEESLGASLFSGCDSLTAITVASGNQAYSAVDGVLYDKGQTTLICYPSGKAGASFTVPKDVAKIGIRAFNNCPQLQDITILNKTCEIGDTEDTLGSVAAIHGYTSSTAQVYADKYSRNFVTIGDNGTGSNGSSGGVGDSGSTGNTGNNTQNTNDSNPIVKVTKIVISGASHKVAVGKSIMLKAAVSPTNAANKQVAWKSSDKKYVTVSSKGKVTAKKAGKTVTITATANDGSGKTATYKITPVKGKVKSVKISGKKTVKAGKSVKLTAKVSTTGKNANKALAWKSSNEKYATVDSKGKVKTKKAGKGKKVTITATATDGSNKKAKVIIKITK